MELRVRIRSVVCVVAVILSIVELTLPCLAGDVAVLKNGFSIRHERREVFGDVTRLYVNADGSSFVDVRTVDIEHFEAAPDLPASDAAAASSGGLNVPVVSRGVTANSLPAASLSDVVTEASNRYRLDPDLVNSVIKAESGFNVRAVSPKGAQGLMQLMPGTASGLGVSNAFDPQANVEGGTRYLRELLERYNFDLVKALAAYNAGPQRVEQFGGVPPYYETRAYVARIVRDFNKKKIAQQKAASNKVSAAKNTKSKITAKSSNTVSQASAAASTVASSSK
jgi:soluble lytic murein transglycosylase-like protein